MKCPHCKKEIHSLNSLSRDRIFKEICNNQHCISSLSKKLKINRGTLKFHLKILLDEKKIKKERLENLTGRQVILKPMRAKNEQRKV